MPMTAKENAKRAVRFQNPERLPVLYFNRDTHRSDFLLTGAATPASFQPEVAGRSEWGFVWVRHDDTMGQPKEPPLGDGWDGLYNYKAPDPHDLTRYEEAKRQIQAHPDRYVIGSLGITGFNTASFIRGFENSLEDLYLEPEKFHRLMELVTSYEDEVAGHLIELGVDCVMFGDDWGTQKGLMIDPAMWRSFFLPFYCRQFSRIREKGVDVCFHCCGQVLDILPDLVEAGANILNLNQPDLFPLEELARQLAGKVCLMCPVDHQTVAIHGTPEEIRSYAQRLNRQLNPQGKGGYIAYIEEYHSVGMSEENYQAICSAFEELRAGKEG